MTQRPTLHEALKPRKVKHMARLDISEFPPFSGKNGSLSWQSSWLRQPLQAYDL